MKNDNYNPREEVKKLAIKYGVFFSMFVANVMPVFGVVFLRWSITALVLFYWAETFIYIIYGIPKIWLAKKKNDPNHPLIKGRKIPESSKLKTVLWFMFIAGFWQVGMVIMTLIFIAPRDESFLDILAPGLFGDFWIYLCGSTAIFALTHGISFLANYIGKKEYERVSEIEEMYKIFDRFFAMHVFIMIIGFVSVFLLDIAPSIEIMLLAGIKTLFDFKAHLFEHKV